MMKKNFVVPSLKVKEFNRASVITLSGEQTTNVETAAAALKQNGIEEGNTVKIAL